MLSTWAPIPHYNGDSPLIIRYEFTAQSYEIQLSDFNSIFTESVRKYGIYEKADEEECPIDPKLRPDQMSLLLDKLRDALAGVVEAEIDFVDLRRHRKTLRVTTDLPEPFQPLKWTFDLKEDPDASINGSLLHPLIATSYARNEMINDLAARLKDKDMAIGKILDKLETSGIDLATVFPAAIQNKRGQKSTDRTQLMRHIKGLSAFDHDQWKTSFNANLGLNNLTYSELVSRSFGAKDQEFLSQFTRSMEQQIPQLRQESQPSQLSFQPQQNSKLSRRPESSALVKQEQESQSGHPFSASQSHSTSVSRSLPKPSFSSASSGPHAQPPQTTFSLSESAQNSAAVGEDDTTDDDDLNPDETLVKASYPRQAQGHFQSIQSNGEPSHDHDEVQAREDRRSPTKSRLGRLGNFKTRDVATESEDDLRVPSSVVHDESQAPIVSKPKRKLGGLGNARNRTEATEEPQPSDIKQSDNGENIDASATLEISPKKPRIGRLGGLGGRKQRTQPDERSADTDANQSETLRGEADKKSDQVSPSNDKARTATEQPEKEETAEEKMERKREELKQSMANNKTSAASKKRRRF